jgi:hypothetical protein
MDWRYGASADGSSRRGWRAGTATRSKWRGSCGALDEALLLIRSTGERWQESDILRQRGDLLLKLSRSSEDEAKAEAALIEAHRIACTQGARSWEMRASLSLAGMYHTRGRRKEALDFLAPVCHAFAESHETPDLIAARQLLGTLQ